MPTPPPTSAENLVVDERAAAALSRGEAVVLDGWLGTVRAEALRLEVTALVGGPHFRAAGVGAGGQHVVAPAVRGDTVCWFNDVANPDDRGGLDPGAEVAHFLRRLGLLVDHLNGTCFLGLRRIECHAACFEPGTGYLAHKDTFVGDARRILSYCYYLNAAWTEEAGGRLRMHGEHGEHGVDVAPLLDRIVLFRSADQLHQVLPTTTQRLSLTGWLSRGVDGAQPSSSKTGSGSV